MAPKPDSDDREKQHTPPCPWMQAMVWAFGILMATGGVSIGHVIGRLSSVESRLNTDHDIVIEIRSDLKNLRASVEKLTEQMEKHLETSAKNQTALMNKQ